MIVTRTVRDLATGTDLAFTPLRAITLRGVPGEWELFEAEIHYRVLKRLRGPAGPRNVWFRVV